jgi:hypothetical protein
LALLPTTENFSGSLDESDEGRGGLTRLLIVIWLLFVPLLVKTFSTSRTFWMTVGNPLLLPNAFRRPASEMSGDVGRLVDEYAILREPSVAEVPGSSARRDSPQAPASMVTRVLARRRLQTTQSNKLSFHSPRSQRRRNAIFSMSADRRATNVSQNGTSIRIILGVVPIVCTEKLNPHVVVMKPAKDWA